jgi:hypothetical protein
MDHTDRSAQLLSPYYKKNIGFVARALASLSWVRYNDPPDLIVERIQQGKNCHASLYLSL